LFLENKDIKEVTLEVDGVKVLTFCITNGFKNIQNIVRQIKKKNCKYDLIEVMACPGGCTHGAGQIPTTDKNPLQRVEDLYKSIKEVYPGTQKPVIDLVEEWLGDDEEKVKKYLYTQFHQVQSENQTSLKIEW